MLREMEKALEKNKTLDRFTLISFATLPKEFCRCVLLGTRRNTSLSDVHLHFCSNWDCPNDGRLVYFMQSCIVLCDSVGCSIYSV